MDTSAAAEVLALQLGPRVPIESVPLPPELLSPTGERTLGSIVPAYGVIVAIGLWGGVYLLGDLVSSRLSKSYASFSPAEKLRWNLRVVAFVHALVSSVAGFRVYYHDTQLWDNPISGWSDLCYLVSPLTWGYMLFDLVFVTWNWNAVAAENPAIILHHLYILVGGFLYWMYAPVAWGYCCNLMVTELSTIFLHINGFYMMTDSAKGNIYAANGMCLLFAFTHRVAVSLYLTYWLYTVSHEIMSVSPGLYNFLFYGSVVLALMNINWYSTLVMRVVQHFLPSLSQEKDDKLY